MISVIIPVLNESATIADVVQFARMDPAVSEVIVVDDGSIDGTPELASAAGAKVIPSSLLGKGASMADGMFAASNELLVYLDGDLRGLRHDLIAALTRPIREGVADFVKAKFSRAAGRVTALTARPMLRVFFPELADLEQPLGGIIAVRRSLLRDIRFETDYGVDIGLLVDLTANGARLAEVDIGRIEHDSQPLEVLSDMAAQVVRVVLDRASRYSRLRPSHLREVAEVERQMQAELENSLQRVGHAQRLALFDMDGTLLQGRFIESLARRTNRVQELSQYLDNRALSPDERTLKIGQIFRGVPQAAFEEAARLLPLHEGAAETVVRLKKAGYRVGVATDGFFVGAEIVRRRVFADFTVAHVMRFRGGRASGDVVLCPAMVRVGGCPVHERCKGNIVWNLCDRLGVTPENVLAVGDGENDICMLQAAGVSVAFQPKTPEVAGAANYVIMRDLQQICELNSRLPESEVVAP